MANTSKQTATLSVAGSTDTVGADHEYHEISDEENQDSPLRFDKPLSFDFGPSLLDEMDQMFRSLGIYISFFNCSKQKLNTSTRSFFTFHSSALIDCL